MRCSLPLAFAVSLAACGGGASPSTGSGGGAGGDGLGVIGKGGAPAATTSPDPGPPPAAAAGFLILANMQGNDGTPKGTATAFFQSPARSFGDAQMGAFFQRYQGVPLDTCQPIAPAKPPPTPTIVDGGELRLTLPDGTTSALPRKQLSVVLYKADLPQSAFVAHGRYVVSGGDGIVLAPFTGEAWSPGMLTVTTPKLDGTPLTISRKAPLDVAWTSTPGGDDVFVFLVQGETRIACRVADDGAFSVPPSALAGLSASAVAASTSSDQLIVQKYSWYAVGAGNAPMLVEMQIGATLDVTYE
jgi:hypothetical protein